MVTAPVGEIGSPWIDPPIRTGTATVKLFVDVAILPPTVTVIGPVVAPDGTVVIIWVDVLLVTTAAVPLNFTILLAAVVLKFVPVIVTVVPTEALAGAKVVIVGDVAVIPLPALVLPPEPHADRHNRQNKRTNFFT